jgi:hypothetical protein
MINRKLQIRLEYGVHIRRSADVHVRLTTKREYAIDLVTTYEQVWGQEKTITQWESSTPGRFPAWVVTAWSWGSRVGELAR